MNLLFFNNHHFKLEYSINIIFYNKLFVFIIQYYWQQIILILLIYYSLDLMVMNCFFITIDKLNILKNNEVFNNCL